MIFSNKCIGETRFFREKRTFYTLKSLIKSLGSSRFEIWSSACATGEEAYSLAIILYEMGFDPEDVRIFATDINSSFLQKAKEGIYSQRDIEKSERNDILKYFDKIDEKHYKIRDEIKKYIHFSYFDLINFPEYKKLRYRFKFILLRNVLIYFQVELIKKIINNIFFSLEDNGILFLGNKEVLYESLGFKRFKKMIFNNTIYYIKKEEYKSGKGKDIVNSKDSRKREKIDLDKFFFYVNNRNIKDAYKFLQSMDKNSFEYFFAKGIFKELEGDEEIAKELYQKAIEIEPEFPLSHLYLGNIYYNKKDYLNTYKEYMYAIERFKEMKNGRWKGLIKEDDVEFIENFLKSRIGI